MQSFAVILSALFALTALAAPTTGEDAARIASRDEPYYNIEFCAVTGDGVRARTCPSTDCTYDDEWPLGTEVAFYCRLEGDDDVYTYWAKTPDGHYVAEYYVDSYCLESVYECE